MTSPKLITALSGLLSLAAIVVCVCAGVSANDKFTVISNGLEYAAFESGLNGAREGKIHILRIDPRQVSLGLLLASEQKVDNRAVSDWCQDYRMAAAINAGMYLKDHKTNVGYLRNGTYVQNRRWNRKYMSVLAFNPKVTGVAPAVLVDLDAPNAMSVLDNYNSVVQNLRLLRANEVNVWGRSEKKWSESAIGMDREGRILFIFCRHPYTMWEFNEKIKSLRIGVSNMMHLEGGPIASLSIRTKNLKLDLAGSYETGYAEEGNQSQWPIPNAIGVYEKQ